MARVQVRKRVDNGPDDRSGDTPVPDPLETSTAQPTARPGPLRRVKDSIPVTLFVASHPRQGLATAFVLAAAALLSGRPLREAGIVLATVLVGQSILGWHNDLVDRDRDAVYDTPHKPVAQGRLDAGDAWYAVMVAVLLVIPLSISVGVTAGIFYLASLVTAILGNVVLRRGRLSPLSWMVSFALYPAYLSYGGYGGSNEGDPPQVALVVVAALLGLGVHVVRSIWGLVQDDQDGWTYLPLVLGRRLGATRLLALSSAYSAVVVAALVILAVSVGLRQ